MSMETYSKGSIIIKEGDASNNKFYIIMNGTVSIIKYNDTNVF